MAPPRRTSGRASTKASSQSQSTLSFRATKASAAPAGKDVKSEASDPPTKKLRLSDSSAATVEVKAEEPATHIKAEIDDDDDASIKPEIKPETKPEIKREIKDDAAAVETQPDVKPAVLPAVLAPHTIPATTDLNAAAAAAEATAAAAEADSDAAPALAAQYAAARALPTSAIAKYWSAKEAARRAPRVHQQSLSLHEKVLREFDVSSRYGPSIGIERQARWERAFALGLRPPVEVLSVLLEEAEGAWGGKGGGEGGGEAGVGGGRGKGRAKNAPGGRGKGKVRNAGGGMLGLADRLQKSIVDELMGATRERSLELEG